LALSEEDIRQLIALKTETKNLDYKESFNWDNTSKDEKLGIIKDILAMANTQDGGRIIFGVRDSDFDFIEMLEDDFNSFDQTKVNDLVHNYTNPKHSCQVYKHIIDGKYVVAIDTPEFAEVPIICTTDVHSSVDPNKQILKKGQIYIRTDKATTEVVSSPEEMRELLGRALAKKGDELLGMIEHLIKGKPLKTSEDSKEKYGAEISEAEKFLRENIGGKLEDYGQWTIYAYPTDYDPNRISDHRKIKDLIHKAEVTLIGWPFPHTQEGNAVNFTKGTQSHTIHDIYIEGYRAYKSGLFFWQRAFWEDVDRRESEEGKRVLSYPYLIWLVTEFLLFSRRYYDEISPQSDLHFRIHLTGTKDRKLVTFDRSRDFFSQSHIASDDPIFVEKDVKVVDLRASYKEIACDVVRGIFAVFNWDDVTEKFIDGWQTKLLEGKA